MASAAPAVSAEPVDPACPKAAPAAPAALATGTGAKALEVDGEDVYWTDGKSVTRMPLGGGPAVPVASAGGDRPIFALAARDRTVWMLSRGNAQPGCTGSITAVGQDGKQHVITKDSCVAAMAVDAEDIFWTRESYASDGGISAVVVRTPRLGGGRNTVISPLMNGSGSIAVSGADVFSYPGLFVLGRMDRDGKHAKPVLRTDDLKGAGAPYFSTDNRHRLVVDDEALYVLAGHPNSYGYDLFRAPRAGGQPKMLARAMPHFDPGGSGFPWSGIAVDARYVYWADTGAGEIRRVDKEARCAPELLAGGRDQPDYLFVTKTGLVWLDTGSGAVVHRALERR